MAKKANKKITAAQMKKSYGHYGEFENEIHVLLDDIEEPIVIHVRSGLGMEDYGNMIADLAQACFRHNDDGTSSYAPYLVDFARVFCLAKYYTDLEIPDNQDVLWRFWNKNNLTEQISNIVVDDIHTIFDRANEIIINALNDRPDVVDKLVDVTSLTLQKILDSNIDRQTIIDFLSHQNEIANMVNVIKEHTDSGLLGMAEMNVKNS